MSAPNLKEIENGIYELEHEESSKAGYALLAALYTCRKEMQGAPAAEPQVAAYSEGWPSRQPVGRYGDSEFLQAIEGKNPEDAWAVMDDLMKTLFVLNHRAYNGVLQKIREL